jgi:exodeoxyribonuclease VII small subunit
MKRVDDATAEATKGADDRLPDVSKLAFETALDQLEGVVDGLENGELDLEVALERFELGVRLTRRCGEQLDVAQRRIDILLKQGGEWMTTAFEERNSERDEVEDESLEDLE